MREHKVVAIGGGTGLFISLQSLKRLYGPLSKQGIKLRLSAIVTVADDGGSTGRLRDEFGYLPPGDLRRALLALSHDTGTLRELFSYRFERGEGLSGHSMGNLLLTALNDIYGSEYDAIKRAGRILRVRGRVIPVTTDDTRLCAELEDGTMVKGETNIDIPKHDGTKHIKRIWLEPAPKLFTPAKVAIDQADTIIIGPGDLYTSLLPNLLVPGLADAIAAARRRGAKIVYVTNTMTKHGETNGFTASDFVAAIEKHLGEGVLSHILVNTLKPGEKLLEPYRKEGAEFVECDLERSERTIAAQLLSQSALVRHDPDLLAKAYIQILLNKQSYVFDLDDTLIRSSEVLFDNAIRKVKEYLTGKGWSEERIGQLIKRRRKIGMAQALKEEGFDDEEVGRIMRLYHSSELHEKFHFDDIDVLHTLKDAQLFLLTKGFKDIQEKKILFHDLEKHFERIIIVDPSKGESKKSALKELMEDEMLLPGNCFVVGDNPYDELAAAQELGAKPILIDRGTRHLGETGSITTITSLHELSAGGGKSVRDSGSDRER